MSHGRKAASGGKFISTESTERDFQQKVTELTGGKFFWENSLFSQARAQDDSQLAKKTQNPVADLISVRCRAISTSALAPETKMIYLLNVQPVIPIKIADD